MRRIAARLHPALALAVLAWFAQLCLPLVHAAIMAAPGAGMLGWCGDRSRALAVAAELPAEIREALVPDGTGADHLAGCAKLCATGATPPAAPVANAVVLRAAGLEHAPTPPRPAPRSREQAPTPPSHGPPAHA